MSKTQVFHHSIRWSVPHTTENQQILFKHLMRHSDKFVFQAEDTVDNPHYQIYCHTTNKIRSKTLAVEWNERLRGINVQPASNNGKAALKNYCMKEDSRVAGPWADTPIYLGADLWPEERMPAWQQTMLINIRKPPNDRTMYWIYDPIGKNGKTKFCKYVVHKENGVGLGYGNSTDVLNLVSKFVGRSIYIWNLTRSKPANLSELDLYSAMESVKDGFFINLKYETKQVLMNPPHVVVVANHIPKTCHISMDRWEIYQIRDHKLTRL